MARDLTWRENSQFAAWGCAACNWVLVNPGQRVSAKPSTQVKEEFNKHECAKFPRVLSAQPIINRKAGQK